jgi:hypothetical protein
MPNDLSLHALRQANPLNQPGFAASIEHYDALGTQIATTPVAASRRLRQPARRRLIALAAAAALSLATTLVALTLTAAPESAYAAAKNAVAASSAGALDSGTMTLSTGPAGSIANGGASTIATLRWNGDDLAIGEGNVLPGFDQLLLVAGGVYLQRADGTWLHYASEADLEPFYSGAVQAAHGLTAGSRAAQLIASAYGLQKTTQPDGSTVYTGTIPPNTPAEVPPSTDTASQIMLPSFGAGGTLQLLVGSNGLVRQISETAAPPFTRAWSIEYRQLGNTASITPPATYTEGTSADLPTPPQGTVPTRTSPKPTPTETVP